MRCVHFSEAEVELIVFSAIRGYSGDPEWSSSFTLAMADDHQQKNVRPLKEVCLAVLARLRSSS